MTTSEYEKFIAILAKTLDEVLTFEVLHRAVYAFKDRITYTQWLNNFFNCTDNNKSLRRLESRFNFREFYVKCIGSFTSVNGRRKKYIKDVLDIVKKNSVHLKYIGKKNVKYPSGKVFSHKSFWIIKPSSVNTLFNDSTYGVASSAHYSPIASQIIHTKILETVMTKKQKKQYQVEFKAGQHEMTLDQYIKHQAQQRRQKDKHKLNIAKKAARETLSEYVKMQLELEQLKQENANLKKNINTNADVDRSNDGIEYEELDKYFPDGLESEDYARLSSKCVARLDKEAREEYQEKMNHKPTVKESEQNVAGLKALIKSGDLEKANKKINEQNAPTDAQPTDAQPTIDDIQPIIDDTAHKNILPYQQLFDVVCDYYHTDIKYKELVQNLKLCPIDYRMRWYLARQDNKYVIIDIKKNTIHQTVVKNGMLKYTIGQVEYGRSLTTIEKYKKNVGDPFFYINQFLCYLKQNEDAQTVSRIQRALEAKTHHTVYADFTLI